MQPLGLVELKLWIDDVLFIIKELKIRSVQLDKLAKQLEDVGLRGDGEMMLAESEKCGIAADVLAVLLIAGQKK